MLKNEPAIESKYKNTSIGAVLSSRGSNIVIGLPAPWPEHDERATVGKFISIALRKVELIGMITEISTKIAGDYDNAHYKAVAKVSLKGEIVIDRLGERQFKRGVSEYPAIGDTAFLVSAEQLRIIYCADKSQNINIGKLNHDQSIDAIVNVDSLLSKHFAILGSTGVGKSSGVAVLLSEILRARSDVRIFLLDAHNEYAECFGEHSYIIDRNNFKLPFWMFNFEELVDVIFGGRPAIVEEVEILAELIPIAKTTYLNYKSGSGGVGLKKVDPKRTGYTVDTPVPYLLQDLLALIDDRMGKLENRSSRMNYHRLLMRIETISNDPRYAFMFENASVGGDTMVELLTSLFRLEPDSSRISVMQMAGLPTEVADAVVCVLCRLAFGFGLWSDGALPLLFVCEEAHRYAAADQTTGFAPTRHAIAKIAKEGRKYGISLGLISQRPAELDPTIISQCSTMFAMRMANEHDQALLRSAVGDSSLDLLDFIPSLGTGEAVGFGEGLAVPARLTFKALAPDLLPRSDITNSPSKMLDNPIDRRFVTSVVDRWRGIGKNAEHTHVKRNTAESPETLKSPPGEEISSLLHDARRQILKR